MEPTLLVLQPTPYCNLDCTYCYLKHRDDRRRMGDDVLRAIAAYILAPCPQDRLPAVLWHAGEPMTLPPDWYDHAFELLAAESGHKGLKHAFQTNAVGVTDTWLELWKKWDVDLGVSIDGPAHIHDVSRKTRAGGGSHRLTLGGIEKMQDAGLRPHIICVLGAAALKDPDGLVDFFEAHGLRDLGFNIEETEGQDAASSLQAVADVKAAYYGFLRRILQRIAQSPGPLACREVDFLRELIARPHHARAENGQVVPFDIVTVCVDGSLSTFSPELAGVEARLYDNFIFGNIKQGGLAQMLAHPGFLATKAAIEAGVAACAASCAYFDICGGGAPSNKFFELNDLSGTQTLYCQLNIQTAVTAVLDALEDETARQPGIKRVGK